MSKTDANGSRVKDDSLQVLNISVVVAIALAAIMIVYGYTSAGKLTLPSDLTQKLPSLKDFQVQGQAFYDIASNKISQFIEWGVNLVKSFKI